MARGTGSGHPGEQGAENEPRAADRAVTPRQFLPSATRPVNPRDPEQLREGDQVIGRGGPQDESAGVDRHGLAQQPQRAQKHLVFAVGMG